MFTSTIKISFFAIFIFIFIRTGESWGNNNKKVRLEDVKTLTLYHGKMTAGRRSNPVPQLQCVGGTAGCSSFVPQVVQCYNRGSDGYDVQWECKTDMDNAFRFGRIDVICEGYDYADDPYILKGSCGLEYTLDLTEEGIKRKGGGGHSYYKDYNSGPYQVKSQKSGFGDIIMIVIILLLIYGIYKTCLRQQQYSSVGDDYDNPDNRFGTGFGYAGGQPPPPGFRSDYAAPDGGCGAANQPYGRRGFGNFWTGAMTGGMLGYMFGNRNRGYQSPGYYSSGATTYSSSSDSSTGTRTASGFGGTRRR